MAETSDVFPACPCPTTATFLTFAPSYTFTKFSSERSQESNTAEIRGSTLEGGASGVRFWVPGHEWLAMAVWVGHPCPTRLGQALSDQSVEFNFAYRLCVGRTPSSALP